ncbi:MAG: hypothetical protein AAGC55_27955, partial [Myxococcota bacterium]
MMLPRRAMDVVAAHCDIVERLEEMPPSARIRRVHVRILEKELERRGRVTEYRELFEQPRGWALAWCPMAEFLLRLACAGALVHSPEQVHRGMYEIMRCQAVEFSGSLLGRALIRLLAHDPVRISEQALAVQRQTRNYGH